MSEEYQARNVVTIIERLSKQLKIELISMYGDLSEHAHPNYLGMMSAYQQLAEPGNPIVRFVDQPLTKETALNALGWTVSGTMIGVEMTGGAVDRERENARGVRALCEEAIHYGGTWPQGVPCPTP